MPDEEFTSRISMAHVQRELGSIESQLKSMSLRMSDGFGNIQTALSTISQQFREVDKKMDDLEERLDRKIDVLEQRIDKNHADMQVKMQVLDGQAGAVRTSAKTLSVLGSFIFAIIAIASMAGQLLAQLLGRH